MFSDGYWALEDDSENTAGEDTSSAGEEWQLKVSEFRRWFSISSTIRFLFLFGIITFKNTRSKNEP